MSQKNARKERTDNKVVALNQDHENIKAKISDLETQIEAAIKAREDKLNLDLEYLHDNIMIVSDKYLTVDGYMDARNTFEALIFGERLEDHESVTQEICIDVAREVSNIATDLAATIHEVGIEKLDSSVLKGITSKNFLDSGFGRKDVCRELLLSNLMRNVEPAIDSIVEFRTQTNEALETLNKALVEAREEAAQSVVTEAE